MAAFRFLHTSDLHLGKPFGAFEDADRLRVARRGVIARLIEAARENDAAHILVAGDMFETPNPAPSIWRQAVDAMADADDLTWWIIPGNHDAYHPREAAATWDAIRELGLANVHVLITAEPVEMTPGVWLLPAPLTVRRPTSDLTGWMDAAAVPEGAIKIGLAHGAVMSFGEGDGAADTIAPDRDRRAGLDYLALGDWHGRMMVSDRIWYSGTPERDRFKHDGPGECLVIHLEQPGAMPKVTPLAIGQFDWRNVTLDLVPGDDVAAVLRQTLPAKGRRDCLVNLAVRGRLGLSDAAALTDAVQAISPEFCHFGLDTSMLGVDIDDADLDQIAASGALRQAGQALADSSTDPDGSDRDRRIAEAALRRLHGLVAGGAR